MKNDLLKTLGGLAVIAAIVVVTFLYGNAQRDSQQAAEAPASSPQVATSPAPQASPGVTPAGGTASVTTPAPNGLQGGGTATPAPTATPSPSPAVAGVATMPETGGEVVAVIGAASMAVLLVLWRRSRQLAPARARSRR